MKNVTLVKGRCPKCNNGLDPKWCGINPTLGTVCRACKEEAHPQPARVFGPENFEFAAVVKSTRGRKPEINFAGTKVMVNGRVGRIVITYGDASVVDFEDDLVSTSIHIGWWELKWLLTQAIG